MTTLSPPTISSPEVDTAFLRLCEALSIPATAVAYLEGERLVQELEQTRAVLAFVLAQGLPMQRDGKFRYHGVADIVWFDTPYDAVVAAMHDKNLNPDRSAQNDKNH